MLYFSIMSELIIPSTSPIYQQFQTALAQRTIILFAGLPGVGKSLYLQQLALMAGAQGKQVHLLQWDVTRQVFELPEVLGKYPEIDGVTHVAIRKGVGMWARQAVNTWMKIRSDKDILIGEVPLIGNRLIELAQKTQDKAEAVLAGEQTLFMIPVPSKRIRELIEKARSRSITDPKHERENADAPSHVLKALWYQVHKLAVDWGMATLEDANYNPKIYAQVYQRLLQHRQVEVLQVNEAFQPQGSVYDLAAVAGELAATPEQVKEIMLTIEHNYNSEELEQAVADWYKV